MDPYADSVDHLLAELRRLDLLLSDRVETWHSESGTIAEFRGLCVTDETELRHFVAELEAVLGGNAKHRRSMQLETRRIAREEGLSLP